MTPIKGNLAFSKYLLIRSSQNIGFVQRKLIRTCETEPFLMTSLLSSSKLGQLSPKSLLKSIRVKRNEESEGESIKNPLFHSERESITADRLQREKPIIKVRFHKKKPFIKDPFIKDPYIKDPFIKGPYIKDPFIKDPFIKGPFIKDPFIKDKEKPFIKARISDRRLIDNDFSLKEAKNDRVSIENDENKGKIKYSIKKAYLTNIKQDFSWVKSFKEHISCSLNENPNKKPHLKRVSSLRNEEESFNFNFKSRLEGEEEWTKENLRVYRSNLKKRIKSLQKQLIFIK